MKGPPVIRLAVVDDSLFVRKALTRLFEGDRRFRIVGVAASGEELLENFDAWSPTAVTLDLSMPGIGGLATIDEVMRRRSVAIVVLSAHTSAEAPLTMEALSRGAVDFIDKQSLSMVDFEGLRKVLTDKLLSIAGAATVPEAAPRPAPALVPAPAPGNGTYDMVLIGASTGGPPAIEQVLHDLGSPSVPIAIVQHMPAGFTAAFAERLNTHLPIEVREASHGARFAPGVVHIAPAGVHLKLKRDGSDIYTILANYPDSTAHRPSVDVLFESALPFAGRAVAALLTGMGDDGATGMLRLAQSGSMTLAQDEASSIVYGMPRAAAALAAVREQLPLGAIGKRIAQLVSPPRSKAQKEREGWGSGRRAG